MYPLANNYQIVDPRNFVERNAEWWRDTPNEKRLIPGYEDYVPSNFMTLYTLDEIENPNIVELNQYCISVQGQLSTIYGEDTSPDAQINEDSFTLQRAYLCVILPLEIAESIFETLEKSDELMVALEHCINNDNKSNFTIKTNEAWKKESKRRQGGRDSIWLTAVIDEYNNIKFPTRQPNRVGCFDQFTCDKKNKYLQFNDSTITETKEFGMITLITHKVGLDDSIDIKDKICNDMLNQKKITQNYGIEFATLQDKKYHISLSQMLITELKRTKVWVIRLKLGRKKRKNKNKSTI